MKRKNVVIGVIGIMILVAIVFALVGLFASEVSAKQIVLSVIKLRSNFDDSIAKAKAITEINELVQDLDNRGINDGWRALASCIPKSCTDDDYMNFIMSVISSRPQDIEHSDLVKEVIRVHRFWGDASNVIVFSQSLTMTNNMIDELHFSTAVNIWNQIVTCNGLCDEYDNLFFELIEVIVDL